MTPSAATTLASHCEAPIAQTAGTHGMRAVRCSQVVGVQRWFDASEREHAACSLHRAARQALYAPADAPWPGDLPVEDEEPVTAATCGLCAAGWLPPHTASLRCESGRRPHCTCSVCF